MKKVLLFTATWCGPCKMFKPKFEEFSTEHENKAIFETVDVDENDTASQYRIRGVPTVVVLDGDKEIGRATGVNEINAKLSQLV